MGISLPHALSYFFRKLDNNKALQLKLDYFSGWLFDVFIKEFKAEGMLFEIPKNTSRIFRGRFTFGSHEWNEREVVKRYILPDDVILELGGGMGVVSCTINRLLDTSSNHVVFEPDIVMFELLQRNRNSNNCGFKIEHAVIGNKSDYSNKQMHRGALGVKFLEADSQVFESDVKVFALDAYQIKNKIHFNTLVMDIEGCEYEFFKAYKSHLSQFRLIILERHTLHLSDERNQEINLLLEQSGFIIKEKKWEIETWSNQAEHNK